VPRPWSIAPQDGAGDPIRLRGAGTPPRQASGCKRLCLIGAVCHAAAQRPATRFSSLFASIMPRPPPLFPLPHLHEELRLSASRNLLHELLRSCRTPVNACAWSPWLKRHVATDCDQRRNRGAQPLDGIGLPEPHRLVWPQRTTAFGRLELTGYDSNLPCGFLCEGRRPRTAVLDLVRAAESDWSPVNTPS